MPWDITDDKLTFVLGVVRQQSITWTNVYTIICRHMALPGHNKLNVHMTLNISQAP